MHPLFCPLNIPSYVIILWNRHVYKLESQKGTGKHVIDWPTFADIFPSSRLATLQCCHEPLPFPFIIL